MSLRASIALEFAHKKIYNYLVKPACKEMTTFIDQYLTIDSVFVQKYHHHSRRASILVKALR
jgi:hypothetical protein